MTKIRCCVACKNSQGEPDLFYVTVTASKEEIDNGDHYDTAAYFANKAGYEGPYVAFDENDSAGKFLMTGMDKRIK